MQNKDCFLCSRHVFRALHDESLHWQLKNQNLVGRVLVKVIEAKNERTKKCPKA